jgi:hypothetical protein
MWFIAYALDTLSSMRTQFMNVVVDEYPLVYLDNVRKQWPSQITTLLFWAEIPKEMEYLYEEENSTQCIADAVPPIEEHKTKTCQGCKWERCGKRWFTSCLNCIRNPFLPHRDNYEVEGPK